MVSLTSFFNGSNKLCNSKMPFRMRMDSIFQRCRLITLIESIRMVKTLEVLSQQSRHTTVMIEGLRDLTISQAEHQISEMAHIIAECQEKSLKRLECEAHLLHSCFHLVLRELGDKKSDHSAEDNMKKAQDLCAKYPDTAGLLLPACYNIKRSLNPMWRTIKTFFDAEFKDVWWHWPQHHVGALEQCPNGHLYSSLAWSDCPECGRRVEKPEDLSSTPLLDQEFVVAMKTISTGFDGTAYRRQLS